MSGALDGIHVIDSGQYLAGPLAALMLGDNGAEVIRVDPPGGPRWHHAANAILQRGKRIEVPLFDAAFQAIGGNAQRMIGKPPAGPPSSPVRLTMP